MLCGYRELNTFGQDQDTLSGISGQHHGTYIRYGSSEYVAPIWSEIGLSRTKLYLKTSFDVTKCLQQIEIPDLHYMCAPCSELPSNISTMGQHIRYRKMISIKELWIKKISKSGNLVKNQGLKDLG